MNFNKFSCFFGLPYHSRTKNVITMFNTNDFMKYAYKKLGYKGHYIFDKIGKNMFYFLFVKIYLQKFALQKMTFEIHI